MQKPEPIDWTRIDNDTNGNPRYVCHFLNLLTKQENGYHDGKKYIEPILSLDEKYKAALKRANKIGGKKYHNKKYGGGIVFQSYNIQATEKAIQEAIDESK